MHSDQKTFWISEIAKFIYIPKMQTIKQNNKKECFQMIKTDYALHFLTTGPKKAVTGLKNKHEIIAKFQTGFETHKHKCLIIRTVA